MNPRPNDDNRLGARVGRVDFLGAELRVVCRIDGGRSITVPIRSDTAAVPEPGASSCSASRQRAAESWPTRECGMDNRLRSSETAGRRQVAAIVGNGRAVEAAKAECQTTNISAMRQYLTKQKEERERSSADVHVRPAVTRWAPSLFGGGHRFDPHSPGRSGEQAA
jgi:TOBE domain